jgi:uncharacterized cupredoxin-like copper-binding protein
MQIRSRTGLTAVLPAVALTVAACTAGSSPSEPAGATMDMASMDEHAEFDFGEPADAGDADRTVEITASDEFAFDPEVVEATVGETITFRVENVGQIVHEFVLGDEDTQHEHEEEMAEMSPGMAMHDEPKAISVEPGETKEITWTFTTAGEVLYGCHEPGHYDAGMVGAVQVSE